jgi:tetratricopeptide (TPR) repeat protein
MKKILMLVVTLHTSFCVSSALMSNYARWRGDRAYSKQDLTQASNWYEKALAQNPQDIQALYCWAKVAYKQKSFEQAEQAFDKVVQDRTLTTLQKEQAFSSLADTAMQLRKYQKAVDNYTQALALNPTSEILKKKLEQARLLLAQQKQEREYTQDEQRKGNSDNTADSNERQQNGQQDNAHDNQGKGSQKQSAGTQHGAGQSQQSPHDTKDATHESKGESEQQRRDQQTTQQNTTDEQKQGNPHNTEHTKPAQDKKQNTQSEQLESYTDKQAAAPKSHSQSHSQYKQKEPQEQQPTPYTTQVPEHYRQVIEAVAQEDKQTLTRLLARAVYKEQKGQGFGHDKGTHGKNW